MDVCFVSVVCCQVEASVWGWSLVQRSPTECGVPECDREATIMMRTWSTGGMLRHCGGDHKISVASWETWSKFHTADPQNSNRLLRDMKQVPFCGPTKFQSPVVGRHDPSSMPRTHKIPVASWQTWNKFYTAEPQNSSRLLRDMKQVP